MDITLNKWITNINRSLKYTILIFIVCSFSGCFFNSNKRPDDYPNTKWICNDNFIWFEVTSDCRCTGYIDYDGEQTKVAFLFGPGNGSNVLVFDYEDYKIAYEYDGDEDTSKMLSNDKALLLGKCKFGKNKFIIEIKETTIFDESVEKLEFYRE